MDDSLIGFNSDGRVRVWHSPNFARNHFERDSLILMSTVNPYNFDQRMRDEQEYAMVEDIWNSVDRHATFTPEFRSFPQYLKDLRFTDVKHMVDKEI